MDGVKVHVSRVGKGGPESANFSTALSLEMDLNLSVPGWARGVEY